MFDFETERERLLYLALALDTEGCIGLYKDSGKHARRSCKVGYRWDPVVLVSSTKEQLPRFLKKKFSGYICTSKRSNPENPIAYNWRMRRKDMPHLLPQVIPFMINRRRQAELLVKALDLIEEGKGHGRKDDPRLDKIEKQLHKLNAPKGVKSPEA